MKNLKITFSEEQGLSLSLPVVLYRSRLKFCQPVNNSRSLPEKLKDLVLNGGNGYVAVTWEARGTLLSPCPCPCWNQAAGVPPANGLVEKG